MGSGAKARVGLRPPPAGYCFADLHLHTTGSDGLCTIDEWIAAAPRAHVSVIAITDHDHIETVREWCHTSRVRAAPCKVIPGVELTARGRVVHVGVLFFGEVPARLPSPGTPLVMIIRWARSIPDTIVVLVHPLPGLWRLQLRGLARAGALPDALETHFPLVGWRRRALARAAQKYHLAVLGASDGHLTPGEIGTHLTLFPGETIDDLYLACKLRSTQPISRPKQKRLPLTVYLLQSIYSNLFSFRDRPRIARFRTRVLAQARHRVRVAVSSEKVGS